MGRGGKVDWDDCLSYSTVKEAVIMDKRLGCMKYSLMGAIAIFILLYQILYQNHYLMSVQPTGTIRFSLRGPTVDPHCDVLKSNCAANFATFNSLPYCAQNPSCTMNKTVVCPYDCTYLDAVSASDQQERTLLITTKTEVVPQFKTPCGINPDPAEKCPRVWNNTNLSPKTNFVADIESYTLMVDHAFTTNEAFNLTQTARDMQGFLESQNETQCVHDVDPRNPEDYTKKWKKGNKLPCLLNSTDRTSDGSQLFFNTMEKLLHAGNVALDTVGDIGDAPTKTHRQQGILVMLEIEYKNSRPWSGTYNQGWGYHNVTYVLRVKTVQASTYKETGIIYKTGTVKDDASSITSRIVETRYGIRMTALLIGELGRFDMTSLLLQLTTSLSLIAIATIIVDYAAIYFLADKERYKAAKYDKTEHFNEGIGEHLFSRTPDQSAIYDDSADVPLMGQGNVNN